MPGPVDLVVLDLMLPGVGGEAVLAAIRDRGDTPVLIASAKRSDQERIAGLRMGADDYLAKPYNPHELTARVAAVLRRSRGTARRRLGGGPRRPRTARTSTRTRCPSMPGAWSSIRAAAAIDSEPADGRPATTRPIRERRRRGPPDARRARACSSALARRPGAVLTRDQLLERGHASARRGLRPGRGRPRREPAAQTGRRCRRPMVDRDDPADGLPAGRDAGSAREPAGPPVAGAGASGCCSASPSSRSSCSSASSSTASSATATRPS